MEGFVGGSCSRDIVRRQAVAAIRSRQPVLLAIRPENRLDGDPDDERGSSAERVTIPMSCSSEGAVDVYIEPRVPLRRIVVVGFAPVADALARLASTLEYNVVRVVVADELADLGGSRTADAAFALANQPNAPSVTRAQTPEVRVVELRAFAGYLDTLDEDATGELVAIVASQGHYDELALEVLLGRTVGFIGLLASRRRASTVLGVLAQQGIAPDRLTTIHNPVGLDIGARTPGEVAVSILAQIVSAGPHNCMSEAGNADDTSEPTTPTGRDPVCGMDVETRDPLHTWTYGGEAYVFCCASCRVAFSADPLQYLVSARTT